jgi:hypothetical protein
MSGAFLHAPSTSWRGVQLKEKHRDNFAFTFYLYEKVVMRKTDKNRGIEKITQ